MSEKDKDAKADKELARKHKAVKSRLRSLKEHASSKEVDEDTEEYAHLIR